MAQAPEKTNGTNRSNSGTSATKKKKKKNKHSTKKRLELSEYAQATLGAGNMREAVRLPNGEDINEWLAVNTVDFFTEITLLYGIVTEYCTKETCPVMSAGPKYEYLWMDGKKYKKPHKCSAPEYIDLLMTWVDEQINDPRIFPTSEGAIFPNKFRAKIISNILKRLFRVYGHLYHHHIIKIVELEADAHLNTCFKHFLYFVREFDLVRKNELAPLQATIDKIMGKDAPKSKKFKPKYAANHDTNTNQQTASAMYHNQNTGQP